MQPLCYVDPLILSKSLQLGVGAILAEKQRDKIVSEVESYMKGLFECLLYHTAEVLEVCMRRFWIDRGWTWPWTVPPCDTS